MERAVQRICPIWLADHRDDLVQNGMIRLMRQEGAELQTAYIYRVAHSVVVDEIRRRKRRPESDIEAGPEPQTQEVDPEGVASGQQAGAAIVDCLANLNDNRRRAVTLYLHGHSVPEIAGLLDWNAKTAENHVYRGLDQLRACLVAKGVTP